VTPLRVVLFSGGRGAGTIVEALLADPRVSLTIAINGYDDGASTGEVRRFLGDALGPSDFRKSGGRVAAALGTVPAAALELLDLRLPVDCPEAEARRLLAAIGSPEPAWNPWSATLLRLAGSVEPLWRQRVAESLARFEAERVATGRAFAFGDCAIGNLVFGGLFLGTSRRFNEAVAAYADLLRLPPGQIEDVTDGQNAFLAAVDVEGALLASEAAIVDARQRNRVSDIFLLDGPVPPEIARASRAEVEAWLAAHAVTPRLNPTVGTRVREAGLIVFAPGTQHSSLFPSYLTQGLGEAVAENQRALKLLVTNLHPDAEIAGSHAVDIVHRALHYLRRRGALDIPTPCLITHSLINAPRPAAGGEAYVAPGPVDQLADPRQAWISDFEAGSTGHHDGTKVLQPFLTELLGRPERPRVALLLENTRSAASVLQTLLELVRADVMALPLDLAVFHAAATPIDAAAQARLPFPVTRLPEGAPGPAFTEAAAAGRADVVAFFDSSGMYQGEDLVRLLAQVPIGTPAAIWGSRRLSVRDIHASYRSRYQRAPWWLGFASYVGSHVLGLLYLLLYGRHVSDTLSGVRVVARRYLDDLAVPIGHPLADHALLAAVLGDQAELRELPVPFYGQPATQARRTTVAEGLGGLWLTIRLRVRSWTRRRKADPEVVGRPRLAAR
jgi:2-phospho-L-lactate transferase/gluconeogenesis factor (CofD/UPF0052 family)